MFGKIMLWSEGEGEGEGEGCDEVLVGKFIQLLLSFLAELVKEVSQLVWRDL